jgi:hypothetical protein
VLSGFSSARGVDLQGLGFGALERVGVRVARDGAVAPRLFAAGDVVADRARTVLDAVHAGIVAARAALA